MRDLITDAMVETATRANYDAATWPGAWAELDSDLQESGGERGAMRAAMRAALEEVAPLIAAAALLDAADAWQTGGWSDSMPHGASRTSLILGMAQRAADWLRNRAERIERGANRIAGEDHEQYQRKDATMTDITPAEWIAKRREEHAQAWDRSDLIASYDALPKALDALEAVRALADNWERLDRAFLAAGTAGMSMPAVDAVRQLRERLGALDGADEQHEGWGR